MPRQRISNPFGPFADPLVATLLAVVWFALLLRFRLSPQWDLAVAGWFFDAGVCAETARADGTGCGGFTAASQPVLSAIREFMHPLPVIVGIVILIVLMVEIWAGRRWRDGGVRLKAVLLATLLVGPGLIINGILKAYWGRPRPWMTEDFGGWLAFVRAGTETDLCAANCSFVSGEASSAGWLMCIALLLAVHRYPRSAIAVGAASFVMAGLRVAFGAHYLSDAVLGYTMTLAIFAILASLTERSARRGG